MINRLACVIVNHDQPVASLAQLERLHDDEPDLFFLTEMVLINNGQEMLNCDRPWFSHVRIVSSENHGYGAAINLGAKHTSAPAILALNADLDPFPGFLAEAHQAAEFIITRNDSPPVGLMGFRLLDDDGKVQGSFGPFPTLARMISGLFRPRAFRKYWPTGDQPHRLVPWVTGACLLIRRDCFAQLEGFDERFFMYYEDVDLCRRAWKRGWKVMYSLKPTCRHLQPYHRRPLTHQMARMARRSVLVYFWKHRPRWEFWFLAWMIRFECWARRGDPGWRGVGEVVERVIAHPHEVPKGAP